MKPLIGITASVTWENEGDAFTGYKRNYLSFDYSDAIIASGGIPIILPTTREVETIKQMVGHLDGLLLSGGVDLSPVLFGDEPRKNLGPTIMQRDESERLILKEAITRQLPILGICRGFQLLNCYFGGTLYQDLSEAKELIKHDFNGLPSDLAHSIEMEEGSLIHKLLGENNLVNSFHHQTLKDLAPNFKVTARAKDGTPEAIENKKNEHFIFAVQFHPEMMFKKHPYILPLFNHFIQEAEKFSREIDSKSMSKR